MKPDEIHETLAGKWDDGTRPKDIYALYISKNSKPFIKIIINGLSSDTRRVQSGCAELASFVSEFHPELVNPYVDIFIENVEAKEKVLRWEAVCTLGNLASIDTDEKIISQIDRITNHLVDDSIVLQGHTAKALAKIAKANPGAAPGIVDRIISSAPYFESSRVGFVIEALATLGDIEKVRPQISKFVESYLDSDVKVVARKAKKALKTIP